MTWRISVGSTRNEPRRGASSCHRCTSCSRPPPWPCAGIPHSGCGRAQSLSKPAVTWPSVSSPTRDGPMELLRDVDRLGLLDLAAAVQELRAAPGAVGEPGDASFSVSDLGEFGGTAYTPVVSPLQVAELGISPVATRACWREGGAGRSGEFLPTRVLPLSLSYDPRSVSPLEAARFTSSLKSILADLAQLLL